MGNTRTLTIHRYGDRSTPLKAYLQAGLHADEAPGFLVMHHLVERLDRADAEDAITGDIVLVPVANPIGVSQWRDDWLQGRFDFWNGVNFNRSLPGSRGANCGTGQNRISGIPRKTTSA